VIKLKGAQVIVKVKEAEEKIGSFYIPEEFRKKQQLAGIFGTVVGVGDGVYTERYVLENGDVVRKFVKKPVNPEIEVGKTVVFSKSARGYGIIIDNEEYLVLHEKDIIATVED
jgi:co-chaperonin GroES (HSP10)